MSADTLCWTDIPVTNLDRAIKFYSAILGKEVRKMSEAGFEYGLLPTKNRMRPAAFAWMAIAWAIRMSRQKPAR
jgi:predicted enzyme related to lactoylglutathione lyase